MGFNAFDIPTMVAVSDPWVNEAKDKPLLASQPLIAGLVPILEKAHTGLLRIRVTPSDQAAEAKRLSETAFALDSEHDARYRALHAILTGCAAISAEKERTAIENLLSELLPEGAAGTQRSYLAESGAVELADSRMTPEKERLLRSLEVAGKNVFVLFNEWVAVGRRLGDVERERVRLGETSADRITAKDVQQARYSWIRAVKALLALLELDSDISDETRIRILQPLRTAEAKFAKKRSAIDPTAGLDPTASESEDESLDPAVGSST